MFLDYRLRIKYSWSVGWRLRRGVVVESDVIVEWVEGTAQRRVGGVRLQSSVRSARGECCHAV